MSEDLTPNLDKHDVVDLVSVSASGDEIVLHLIVDQPWDEKGVGTLKLQAKLKNYVAFAADGQLLREYPQAAGKQITIRLLTEFPLGTLERRLIEAARSQWCAPEGITIRVELHEDRG